MLQRQTTHIFSHFKPDIFDSYNSTFTLINVTGSQSIRLQRYFGDTIKPYFVSDREER